MREIKFRAWDTRYNLFQKYDDEYISLDDGKCYEVNGTYDGGTERLELPYILSQYTGLKDKNGKEIYEGDLVVRTLTGSTFKIFYSEKLACYRVERLQDGWNFSIGELYHLDDIEVIGNIYENPELLGESK